MGQKRPSPRGTLSAGSTLYVFVCMVGLITYLLIDYVFSFFTFLSQQTCIIPHRELLQDSVVHPQRIMDIYCSKFRNENCQCNDKLCLGIISIQFVEINFNRTIILNVYFIHEKQFVII